MNLIYLQFKLNYAKLQIKSTFNVNQFTYKIKSNLCQNSIE